MLLFLSPIVDKDIAMATHAAVKAALEAQLDELTRRGAEIEADLSNPGSSDWSENAVESEDDEVLSRVGRVTKDEIQEIRLALNQIETGHYGTCTACGGKISKERLDVMPYATKCIRCA
jgi:RNA polymerase-binding transcription factor DksA